MIETAVVFTVVLLLAGIGLVAPLVPAQVILHAGVLLILGGGVFGLPAGFWYHVRLRAVLLRDDALPARWWIRPVALHGDIPAAERSSVLRWFYLGGLGFFAIVLGSFTVAAGVLLEAHRGGAF